jgi:Mlc titration factor MtfA (ptsG expression regulator)
MWSRLLQCLRQRREAAAVARKPIPDLLWRRTLRRFPFLPRAGTADEALLRRMTSLFLDRKEFSGAHGLVISDDMAVAIAAQACLPVLRMDLDAYQGFVGVVVHPGLARARRSFADDDGVVHEFEETLSGEALEGGPVMLSWRDVRSAGARAAQGYNVVIHEFVHVLDMADGLADGLPLLPTDISRREWRAGLDAAYQAFFHAVDSGAPTALDPYGAESPSEFFAVASEAFFVAPQVLQADHPAVYGLLMRYFRQDTLARLQQAPLTAPPEPQEEAPRA